MSFFHMLAGTISSGGDTVEVQTVTIADSAFTNNVTTTSSASIIFDSDSTVDYTRFVSGNTNDAYNWIIPADNAANYEVRATVVSGPTGSGSSFGNSASTWHSLASDVQFGVSISAIDATTDYILDIEISQDSGSTIAASGRVTLRATVQNLGGL